MRVLGILAAVALLGLPAGAHATTTGRAVPVTLKPLAELAYFPITEASANVVSLADSKLGAEVNAKIIQVGVQVGDVVEKGALLFRLDSSDFELALKRAKANLLALDARRKLAKSQAERALSLVAKNFVSREFVNQRQAEFEAATAELLAQDAQVTGINRDIAKCIVRAPYKGIVKARFGQIGEFAVPGQPLVNLVDIERVEASAQIQSAMLTSFKQAAAFSFVARGTIYPVKLRILTDLLDSRERSQEARFGFPREKALPGESGVIRWQSKEPYVPGSLLVQRNGKLGLFVKDNGAARFIEIHSAQAGRPAPVPLPLQTLVIVDGRHSVNDGDRVE